MGYQAMTDTNKTPSELFKQTMEEHDIHVEDWQLAAIDSMLTQSAEQAAQQSEIDAKRQAWDLQQSEPYRRAQAAMGVVSGGPTAMVGEGASPGSKGLVPGILQGAMGGGMAGGSVSSGWNADGGAILGGLGGGAANK